MNQKEMQESQYLFPYHHLVFLGDEGFSETKHLPWGYQYASYIELVRDEVLKRQPRNVLDIGCGDGKLLHELRRKDRNIALHGIDFSERAIAFAQLFSPDVHFSTQTMEEIIATGETFDVLTCIEVVEHIPPEELPGFLSDYARLLDKEHGTGIITVPSVNLPLNSKHYQHFSAESLCSILSPYVTVEKVFYLNKVNWRERIIKRLFANSLFILHFRPLLRVLYKIYVMHFLHASAGDDTRVMAIFHPSHTNQP